LFAEDCQVKDCPPQDEKLKDWQCGKSLTSFLNISAKKGNADATEKSAGR
jgi:hypothetical protein